MLDIINEKRANFKFKTFQVIYSIFCCFQAMPRKFLRKSVFGRSVLNYQLGNQLLNKDLDIAKIILKMRIFKNFMNMLLELDQRKLLKIRSSKFISSDIDDKFPDLYYRKIKDDEENQKIFVDNIRNKKIQKKDIKLLQITGLGEIVKILQARELYIQKI